MPKVLIVIFLALLLSPGPSAWPQRAAAPEKRERIDAEINARIREEGMQRSQLMRTLHFLTDIYYPRSTGTPTLEAAGEWALAQMQAWGLEHGHLEPWDFGSPGWASEKLVAHIVSPIRDALVCEAVAWTPGTNGTLTAPVYQMTLPENPTPEDLNAYFESVKEKVKGKIVLAGRHQLIPVSFNPPTYRLTDEELKKLYAPKDPNAPASRSGGPQQQTNQPARLTPLQVNEQIDRFLFRNGASLRVIDAGMTHGVIRAYINRLRDASQFAPTVVMRNEDYGRISRILADGTPVELEFNIVNRFFPEGRTAYNVIAEIPGAERKEEVVMLGAHLDAHHLAAGATDNAVGCAVMMEAVRILKAIGAKPWRTIRIGLWSGEEQRVLGSQAYVREHFGSFESPKADFEKFSAYFNLDTGTGRLRGMRVFGPPEAADVLRQTLAPFADFGVAGVTTYTNRTPGGSDHASFSQAGLPGVYIDQDQIEYGEFTWHTNLDTYERIIEDDAKKNAIVIASAIYHLAMRDELLSRFSGEQMPPPFKP